MKVSFSVGPMSDRIINSISTSIDNVEFFTYGSVQDMIKESTMRHIFFDRIVLSEKILRDPEEELKSLNDYISEYSDNTTVVLICQNENSNIKGVFSGIFNSPLYTAVVAPSVTISTLSEFVREDIKLLRKKYLKEEIKEVKAVTNKYVEETKNSEKKEKQGFFKSIFGGKKNKGKKEEIKNEDLNNAQDEGKVSEEVSKNGFGLPSGNFVPDSRNSTFSGENTSSFKNDRDGNSGFSKDSLGSDGNNNYGDEFDMENSESEDLGIDSFGKLHSDTGYFDDEDEKELDSLLQDSDLDKKSVSDLNVTEGYEQLDGLEGLEGTVIVVGERGVGVTSYIVDCSIMLAHQNKSVLIVDLDYINNGVLSYVDTYGYMAGGYNRGISRSKIYSEEGVSLLSNGYGSRLSNRDITNIINMINMNRYDVVFIDCPLDCIDVLNESLLENSRVIIKVAGNRGSLLSTFNVLGNREKVSVSLEERLYNLSEVDVVNIIDEYEEDIHFLRDILLFSRCDWLSKLG